MAVDALWLLTSIGEDGKIEVETGYGPEVGEKVDRSGLHSGAEIENMVFAHTISYPGLANLRGF